MYYLADRETDRLAWRAPRFMDRSDASGSLTVELDDATWRAVSEEALRQGVATEALATHAVIYFLADLDSGRVAGLLEDALEAAD